jgi:hypothetical protein
MLNEAGALPDEYRIQRQHTELTSEDERMLARFGSVDAARFRENALMRGGRVANAYPVRRTKLSNRIDTALRRASARLRSFRRAKRRREDMNISAPQTPVAQRGFVAEWTPHGASEYAAGGSDRRRAAGHVGLRRGKVDSVERVLGDHSDGEDDMHSHAKLVNAQLAAMFTIVEEEDISNVYVDDLPVVEISMKLPTGQPAQSPPVKK